MELFIGVTSNLVRRIYGHREGLQEGFSLRYGCKILVFYELCLTMENAILREKQIKSGTRARKLKLIDQMNPKWIDLYPSICH